jgi:hypothetical protein
MRNQRGVAVLLSLLLAVFLVAVGQRPASAGTWSGSTPDNGMGQSVSVEGTSTETANADGSTTYTSETTTTIRDNATGKVVKVIRRSRKVNRTKAPARNVAWAWTFEELTTYGVAGTYAVTAANYGTWTVGGKTQSYEDHRTEQYGPDPDNGRPMLKGGEEVITEHDGSKRTTTRKTYNPQTHDWQTGAAHVHPLQTSKAPEIYLPGHAVASCPVGGTIVTGRQETAPGTVVATGPKGRTETVLVDPHGHFTVPSTLTMPGTLHFNFFDQGGAAIGSRTLRIVAPWELPGNAMTTPPTIVDGPPFVLGGGIGQLNIFGRCNADDFLGPSVYFGTPKMTYTPNILAWSGSELDFRLPLEYSVGRGSLMYDNGLGELSRPKETMAGGLRVDYGLGLKYDWTPSLGYGRYFDTTFHLDGLPGLTDKPIFGTPWLLTPPQSPVTARMPDVPFTDGIGHLPVEAWRPGAFGLGLTGFAPQPHEPYAGRSVFGGPFPPSGSFNNPFLTGPFTPLRDLPVEPPMTGGLRQWPSIPVTDFLHPVPIAQAPVGVPGTRYALTPPGPGFTQVTVKSSDGWVVEVAQPNNQAQGGWGFDFHNAMPGVSVITVTWTNPQTGETRTEYVVIGSGVVIDSAKSVFVPIGQLCDAEDDYYDDGYDYAGSADSGHTIREFGVRDWRDANGVTHVDVRVLESDWSAGWALFGKPISFATPLQYLPVFNPSGHDDGQDHSSFGSY